jgi:beta-phosphoglucomutase-like phosphatase (HAD superfamily)
MGRNSESAPGAIVTQDVPANHIAFGVPAKRMVRRPETKLRGVILELENVLLEPAQILSEALGSVLDNAGKDIEKSRRSMFENAPPAKVIYGQLGKERGRGETVLQEYLSVVRSSMQVGLRLRSHGKELVEKIRERGLKVAVISRQPDILAKEIADSLDLLKSLDFICGADDFLSEWKPQPWIIYRPMRELKLGVERVIYIAGSLLDLETGIEAALRVYWIPPPNVAMRLSRGLVDSFPNLQAVLAEFSRPQLPQTF